MGHTPQESIIRCLTAHHPVKAVSPEVDKPLKSVTHGQCGGYVPNCRASLPLDRYQIILLGDRGTCVRSTCPRLLPESGTAGSPTCDLLCRKPTPQPLHHQAISSTFPRYSAANIFLPVLMIHYRHHCKMFKMTQQAENPLRRVT